MPQARIVDLSVAVDPNHWEPEATQRAVTSHQEGGDILGRSYAYFRAAGRFGRLRARLRGWLGQAISHRDFPDGMGLSTMTYTLTTHTGTHLDAPYHYGWRSGNTGAMTVDGIPLEWCYGPGVYLDLSAARDRVESVSAGELIAAAERIGRPIAADDIVLIGTGMPADHVGSMRYFTRYRGISGEAVGYLLDRGVKVIGTDTFSFDPPFCDMLDAYCKSGDKRVLWPAHVLGRDRPYIQIERLGGLDALPAPCGFMVACFPIKLKNSDAAWARVAAIYHEQGMCS